MPSLSMPTIRLPSLSKVRQQFGSRSTIGPDLGAGAVLGIESVPDGLAAGLLAGVNPVFGLYGYLVGTFAGSLSTSSAFMTVQATGAMAVIISDVPQIKAGDAGPALATLALLTGAILVAGGLLGFGKLVRFVSNSVLVGFVNAVALSIILGQLDNLSGYDNQGSNKILQAADTLLHLGSLNWPSVAIGLACIVLILGLERTPLKGLGLVVAVALTSGAVALFGMDSVATVGDLATVPSALPGFALPKFALIPALLIPALSLAFVASVQGSAISGTVENPDGELPEFSGDMRGMGVANLACSVLGAMPVGGSMSATSLVRASGAQTRLANLFAAIVMGVVLLTLAGPIGHVAMPALAGLLIVIGVRTLRINEARSVWRTGQSQATSMTVTFVLTLLIPLQYAVLVGVGVSVLLHAIRQSNRIEVRRWVRDTDGHPLEVDPPDTLDAGEVVVLMVFGSLFFASAATLDELLPKVGPLTRHTTVILRLRGQDGVGTTALSTIRRYAAALDAVQSRLVLVGVGERLKGQLASTGTDSAPGVAGVIMTTARIGDGTQQAVEEAERFAKE